MRKLWARVEQACGLAPEPRYVAAETAWRMMTRRDPYVNILRTTIAVVRGRPRRRRRDHGAAVHRGARPAGRFARRVARNTQLILLEESNLAKVADPAAGSGGIEDLTDKLCAAAWALFQEIEKAGGVGPRSNSGLIQNKVAATRAEREKNIARRKDALTGTSEFPESHEERPVHVLDVAPLATAARRVSARRLPSPAAASASPSRSKHCATPPIACSPRPARGRKCFSPISASSSDFTARAMFAKNFFEAGGIEAVTQ